VEVVGGEKRRDGRVTICLVFIGKLVMIICGQTKCTIATV